MRLALAVGRTPGELLGGGPAMSAAEFDLLAEHYRRDGFPADRIEAGAAVAGAAVCQVMGGKVRPADLIPRFSAPDPGERRRRLKAWLESLPVRE